MCRILKIGNTCGNSVGLSSWMWTAAIKSIARVQALESLCVPELCHLSSDCLLLKSVGSWGGWKDKIKEVGEQELELNSSLLKHYFKKNGLSSGK